MYQQESHRKQATSGSRAGESFWQEESNNFGKKLMHSMGWSEGKGLGKNETGQKQYLRAKYKADAKGIGAKADQEDATWTATQDVYTDLLKRLKTENASPSPTPVEESVEVTETTTTSQSADGSSNTTTVLKNYIAKRTLYGRFKKAKDTSNYSATAMSEIFGRKPSTPTPPPAAAASSSEDTKVKVKSEPDHELLQTSKLSIRDYFAQKLAAAGKLGGMSAQEFAKGGLAKPEPVVKEEEQPRGFTMDQQEDCQCNRHGDRDYNRMMGCAISGGGVQTGQRAKVGLGFGGAGTGGNTGYKTSALNSAKKSVKIEMDDDAPMHDPAPSPVGAYEEEAQDAAAVDAAPHGTVGHDSEEAKQRRKLEKKQAKKRKREQEEEQQEEESTSNGKHEPLQSNGDASDEKSAKKAKKRAKKEAAAAAAAAEAEAEQQRIAEEEERERKRQKKEKKAAKKAAKAKKDESDSD